MHVQEELAFSNMKSRIVDEGGNGSVSFCDPAFAGNKSMPIHRWVPWIAGFSRDFVRGALEQYLERPGVVLDPFCGVGTTLVEAAVQGHEPVGFEINPYAALAAQSKLYAGHVNTVDFRKSIEEFGVFCDERRAGDYQPISAPPPGLQKPSRFL